MHNGYLKNLKPVVHFYNTRDTLGGEFIWLSSSILLPNALLLILLKIVALVVYARILRGLQEGGEAQKLSFI
jgi:hypothetical protein